jgi:hypothetical protein
VTTEVEEAKKNQTLNTEEDISKSKDELSKAEEVLAGSSEDKIEDVPDGHPEKTEPRLNVTKTKTTESETERTANIEEIANSEDDSSSSQAVEADIMTIADAGVTEKCVVLQQQEEEDANITVWESEGFSALARPEIKVDDMSLGDQEVQLLESTNSDVQRVPSDKDVLAATQREVPDTVREGL